MTNRTKQTASRRGGLSEVGALALCVGLCAAGCGKSAKDQNKEKPAPAATTAPTATAPTAPAAVKVELVPRASWGQVTVEAKEGAQQLTFEMKAESPAVVRLPAGATLELTPLPGNSAEALAAEAYTFELVKGAGGKKAAGFEFATKESLDRDPVTVSVKPGKKEGAYAIAVRVGKRHLEREMERDGDCNLKPCESCKDKAVPEEEAFHPGIVGVGAPGGKEAFAALSKELEGQVAGLADPGAVALFAALFFTRALVDVDRIRRAGGASLCGADKTEGFEATLSYRCDHAMCKVRQVNATTEMKRGDDLTFGPGGEIEFLSFED